MEDKKIISDKDLYTIAVMKYEKEHPDLDDSNLFPIKWNTCEDYYLKNIILASAIKDNILVEKTELYKKYFNKNYNKNMENDNEK